MIEPTSPSVRKLLAAAALVALVAVAAFWLRSPERAVAAERATRTSEQHDERARELAAPNAAERARTLAPSGPIDAALEAAPGALARIRGIVRDRGGDAVPGAACRLLADVAPGAWTRPAGERELARATSGADGRFELPAPAPHARIVATADGFAPATARHVLPGADVELVLERPVVLLVRAVDAAGAPVAGAICAVHADFAAAERPVLARAATGADGTAELAPLAAGEVYLTVQDAAHARRHETVVLEPGVREHEVRLVLQRGVKLVGRVRGADGPLAGATLQLEAPGLGEALPIDVALAADGSFETAASFLPDERLVAVARAPGHAERDRLVAIPIDAAARGVHELDLVLEGAGRHVTGRVVDASGAPSAGAEISYVRIEPVARGDAGLQLALVQPPSLLDRWRGPVLAGDDGRFRLADLPVYGQLVVAVLADGAAPVYLWPPQGAQGEEHDVGDVAVEPAGSVSGALVFEDGRPAPDVPLVALRELLVDPAERDTWRPSSWWRPHRVRSADDGSFRIGGLAAGRYGLTVGEEFVGAVTVQAGRDNGPRTWTAPWVDPDARGVRISGSARDAAGRALRGVFVAAWASGVESAAGDGPLGMTFTDVAGRFRFDAPAGVSLELRASDPKGRVLPHVEELGIHPSRVVRDLVLVDDVEERQPLVGSVRAHDGAPLAGMAVDLEPPEHRWCGCITFTARTDANGIVVFERLARGKHVVRVRDPEGRHAETVLVDVEAGGHFDVVMRE